MLSVFDFARDMDLAGVLTRLILAVLCGGIIGIERELKRRPAGFRTHILICLGAAVTTLTSQYLYLSMHMYTDIARLGAQVISGIGFIGAGSIIITKRKSIKGITTAAGLWTTAIIGLVCGAGYVECGLVAALLILFAEVVLSRVEHRIAQEFSDTTLYVEYLNPHAMEDIIHSIKEAHGNVTDIEITRAQAPDKSYYYCALLEVQASRKLAGEELLDAIRNIQYVKVIDEL